MLLIFCTPQNEVTAQELMEKMYITIDGVTKQATLEDNTATRELVTRLQEAPVTVMLNSSGGFEIWGALGFSLPTSNTQVNAQPGDIVLYSGSNICMFYGTNSWSYTRLGHLQYNSQSELEAFLKAGQSNIRVTLSLDGTTALDDVQAAAATTQVYTLSGQPAPNGYKGIVIQNGKKKIQ